jgi:PAS domain S-box-containing protein
MALKKLRALDSDLPIIVLTNHEDVELAINAVRYGAQDYLIKSQITSHFLSLAIRYAVERKKTEKFHREQLHFLQSVMDNIPNPLYMKGTDLLFGACNTAFEKLFGITKNSIIGKTVFDIFDKEASEIIREKELKLLSGDQIQIYELSFKDAGGDLQTLFFQETAHRRADGKLAGLIGVGTDISEMKKVELSLQNAKRELERKVLERTKILSDTNELLKKQIAKRKDLEKQLIRERKIFMNGPVIVFRYQVVGEQTIIEYVSPTISRFGYSVKDFLSGKLKYSDIIHPDCREKVVEEIMKCAKLNIENFDQEFYIKKTDGEKRCVHSSVVLGRDEKQRVTHLDGYLIDITDWK